MKAITLPVRPPTLPSDSAIPLAAFVIAGAAEEVTRERPWAAFAVYSDAFAEYSAAAAEALDAVCLAVSLALDAVVDAVVDSNLRGAMRPQARDCRSIGRASVDDIFVIRKFGRRG